MTRVRERAEIAWGGIDQVLSSATNLGLSVLAGRLLGASGVGLIFIGFSSYLLALSLARGFITAPFVVATAACDQQERDLATRRCMTLVFFAAIALSALMVAIGFVAPDPVGRSLLVFAPWTAAGLVQDQWRSVLFRDQRGAAAAFNDATWVVGMIVILPFVWASPNDWTVAATWGAGGAFAALLGWWQIGLRPSGFVEAAQWWNRELRRLGTWLAIESILIATGSQVIVIMLAAVLSASDLGGIRVVMVVFAPMTLINEAFTFPGLPIMARALAKSMAEARQWAWRLGFGAVAIVGLYLAVITPFSGRLLSNVFGPDFEQYTSLVLPTALAQIPSAIALGFLILLKADRRGHAIVVNMAIRTAVTLPVTQLFAVHYGARGAVWGMAVGSSVAAAATIFLGLLSRDVPLRMRKDLARQDS